MGMARVNLVQMSFSGGLIILAIAAVRLALFNRLPKKTFYILWLVALIRLLVPFSLSSCFGVYTFLQHNGTVRTALEGILGNEGLSAFVGEEGASVLAGERGGWLSRPGNTERDSAAGTGADGHKPAAEVVTEDARPSALGLSFWLIMWALGAWGVFGFFAVLYVRCRREFAMSLPVASDMAGTWRKNHSSRRKIAIRQSDRVASPLSYGIFRPVILMPKTTDWSDRSRLFYVWEHEYVHIRRLDAAVKLLMAAALCLHWCNPLVWLMYVLFNRDIEMSCDEAVIRHFGREARAAYAMTLIGMAEKQSGLGLLYSSFSKNVMEGRIRSIMKIQKNTILTTAFTAVLVGAACLTFAISPAAGNAEGAGNGAGGKVRTEDAADVLVEGTAWIDEDTEEEYGGVKKATLKAAVEAVGYDRAAITTRIAEIEGTIEAMDVDESKYTKQLQEEKAALEMMLGDLELQESFSARYGAYDVEYRLPENRLYKGGKIVMNFHDEGDDGILWWDDEGEVSVEVIRDEAGDIFRLVESPVDENTVLLEGNGELSDSGGTEGMSSSGQRSSLESGETSGQENHTEEKGQSAKQGNAVAVSELVEVDSAREMHEFVQGVVYNIGHGSRFSEYEEFGLSYDEESGYLNYDGKKIGRFKDEWEPDVYTLYSDPTGEVAIEVVRDKDGKITSIQSSPLTGVWEQAKNVEP